MSAPEIVTALGGRWQGTSGMARCPVHDDRTPSLSVRDGDVPGRVVVHCFAGCSGRDVIAELRRRGLLGEPERVFRPRPPVVQPQHKPDAEALAEWNAATAAPGSVVEKYLASRGIALLPASIRFGYGPAMVVAVQAPSGTVIAVQSLLLTPAGQKASARRITTGLLGYGAARFAKAGDVLGITEGAEDALSAMQLTNVPCWASLGAGRMHRVAIPEHVRELHIFGDNDEPGRAAAERTATAHSSRRVVIRFPPDGMKDWNDALLARRIAA